MGVNNETLVARVAESLARAERETAPVAPPTATEPGLTVADAYLIQRLNIDRRISQGEHRVGHKIGLTSLAIQQQLGVDQPDFGVIMDTMVVPNGGSLATSELIAPRVEAEFAFRFDRAVPPSPSLDQLRDAIEGVAVALEVIDSRVADWKITLVDTVADNASSARIVYGGFRLATPELLASIVTAEITLARDGSELVIGPGSAVLGDPVVSLHWLATAIGAFGDGFDAGDIVLAGAVAAAIPLVAGSTFSATSPGFDVVELSATAAE